MTLIALTLAELAIENASFKPFLGVLHLGFDII